MRTCDLGPYKFAVSQMGSSWANDWHLAILHDTVVDLKMTTDHLQNVYDKMW